MNKYIMWRDLEVGEIEGKSNWGDQIIIVRQDGLGNSTTVQGAVNLVPYGNTKRIKILIYPGIYREKVYVPRGKSCISFIGKEGETENEVPIITNNTKASNIGSNGQELGTNNTYTVFVQADYFCATSITIENNAVPDGKGDQGVALRMDGDKAMLYRECTLNSTRRGGAIAAHEREENDETGFSFVGCKIQGLGPTLLGRAWGNHSRIVYSYCTMDDIIHPLGWNDWGDPSRQKTSMFGEYRCEGEGSNRSGRTKWSFSLKDEEAMQFLGRAFIKGYTWLAL
ncbi:pectinesterase QRT1-like [Senna tora]|uniref:pectinesterase n=1 Tax=Senna tora TaxID=362788 RepID=A0A834WCF9_9FABA|nr:pectinesterase QRT1-like [Senna tora]